MEESDQDIRTRSGYKPSDCLKAFQTALQESGTVSIGKALHFSADLICSGGFEVWVKSLWEYALEHIGIASPRLFVYLKKRIGELDAMISRFDEDTLWKDEEFQTRISEIIFVIKDCPRRSKLPWPKVGPETHRDGWLRSVQSNATETEVVKRVYKSSNDLYPLHTVSCEIVKAFGESATERAMFWVKWLQEEDARLKKENSGAGLSTLDRGPPHLKGKGKTDVCYYLLQLFAEVYKELAAKQLIRMTEEIQCLLDIFKASDSRIGGKQRKDILALLIQILSEVPKWKVPAAPSLIKDPVVMSRAVSQSPNFFKEVLKYPKVATLGRGKSLFTSTKLSAAQKEKAKKGQATANKFEAFDAAFNAYLNK